MRRRWLVPLGLMILCLALLFGSAAAEESGKAQWTVMFYLCGSDLESVHSFATGNLEEISHCGEFVYFDYSAPPGSAGTDDGLSLIGRPHGDVQIVIETGGSKVWHAQSLGMRVDSGYLQRWHYTPNSTLEGPYENGFTLMDSRPLASMADSETLADFIRWSVANYPAEKYALVLWDHGGGSKTGLFIDELFPGDVMSLQELNAALRDGGVVFENILFDACMMANLETAYSVKDYAKWMVGSEEVVAGKGTAIADWLQQLLNDPQCDGRRLGRWICDMTQIKYANEDDEQTQNLMTWSVIDLSAIGHLADVFDRYFEYLGQLYVDKPFLMSLQAFALRKSECYGSNQDSMIDLAQPFYSETAVMSMDADLRRELLDAISDAVIYCVRGTGRSAARGLSFCYAVDFDIDDMDTYADNCPSPHFLAFLDAISPWTAPDSVYSRGARRLPEIDTQSAYVTYAKKEYAPDGVPGFSVISEQGMASTNYFYNLYRKSDTTNQILWLGSAPVLVNEKGTDEPSVFSGFESWQWPFIEGTYCSIEMLNSGTAGDYNRLYNIPLQIGADIWNLRVSFNDSENAYDVYGFWEGYDSDSEMFNRNVKSLSQFSGQHFRLLYPIDTNDYHTKGFYEASSSFLLYKTLEVEDRVLPPGTYYLQYVVNDLFERPMTLDTIEMYWDGQHVTFPEGFTWEGTVKLSVRKDYW